jgi:hypothetical protein
MDEINGEHNKESFFFSTNAFDNYVCMFFQASLHHSAPNLVSHSIEKQQ